MADSITSTGKINLTNGNLTIPYGLNNLSIGLSGSMIAETIYNLPAATWVSVPTGSVTNARYAYFTNLPQSSGSIALSTLPTAAGGITPILLNNDVALIPLKGGTAVTPQFAVSSSVASSSVQFFIAS